jgi:phospholipase C
VSGTSWGHGSNDAGFGAHTLPQRSIFQQLSETNRTWINYSKSGTSGDAKYFNWTVEHDTMANFADMTQFFSAAANGSLPEFSYINPTCCGVGTNSMHPSGLVSDGEAVLKNIYEALRASPQWKETLFIITFDESGGFHDHVAPPVASRPDNQTFTTSTPDGDYTFTFDRLGGRLPTFLISPYVNKGFVEQFGRSNAGQPASYSATSILRTLGYLWDFTPFNTRIEESPSFDHLILSEARDTIMTLPPATSF